MTITAQTHIAGWKTVRGAIYAVGAGSPVADDATGEFERLSRGLENADTVAKVRGWTDIAAQASKAHRVPLAWILAVMHVESGGVQNAVSPAGAVGLMQIMPSTAALYHVPREHLFHPGTNVFLGARILRDLQTGKTGAPKWDLPAVASMYNAGPLENPIRPKPAPGKPWGYAEDPPYIFNVCSLNNFYLGDDTGRTSGVFFGGLIAAAGVGLLMNYRR